jgi:hypothetical protein
MTSGRYTVPPERGGVAPVRKDHRVIAGSGTPKESLTAAETVAVYVMFPASHSLGCSVADYVAGSELTTPGTALPEASRSVIVSQ